MGEETVEYNSYEKMDETQLKVQRKKERWICRARSLADLCGRMNAEWKAVVPELYPDLPTWGPETPAVKAQISAGCTEGDIASWDTRPKDVRKHRYLRREWCPAHEPDMPEQVFSIITHAQAAEVEKWPILTRRPET
jgi:hypothetical protein